MLVFPLVKYSPRTVFQWARRNNSFPLSTLLYSLVVPSSGWTTFSSGFTKGRQAIYHSFPVTLEAFRLSHPLLSSGHHSTDDSGIDLPWALVKPIFKMALLCKCVWGPALSIVDSNSSPSFYCLEF